MSTRMRYSANARDDKRTRSLVENHNFTAQNTHAEKNSRTSSSEDKVEMRDIMRKYKVVNYADKKTWSEAMELERVTSQAAPRPRRW